MRLNKIKRGDCISGMRELPDKSIDLIVTDPPYLINYKTGHRKDKDHRFTKTIANDDNEQLIIDYIEQCYRVLKDNTAMYMFCSMDRVDFFKAELEKRFKVKNIIIWVKNNHTAGDLTAAFGKKYEIVILVNKGRREFNGARLTDVWEFDRVVGPKQLHQNQKPVELIKQCILKHSNPGDTVLDGFAGSATTAIAAIETGRNFVAFELDDYYYRIARRRIVQSKRAARNKLGT